MASIDVCFFLDMKGSMLKERARELSFYFGDRGDMKLNELALLTEFGLFMLTTVRLLALFRPIPAYLILIELKTKLRSVSLMLS